MICRCYIFVEYDNIVVHWDISCKEMTPFAEIAAIGTEEQRLFFQICLYVDRDMHILVDHEAAVLHDLVPCDTKGKSVKG